MSTPKDNILFIFTDQWKTDCTGFHGHPIVKTPNLDQLATMSADFENANTIVPLCTPARGCIMSGLLPHQSGVVDNCDVGAAAQEYMLKNQHLWLNAAVDAGYKTAYYGKWHLGPEWPENQTAVDFDPCRTTEWNRAAHERGPVAPAVTERGQLKPKHPIQPTEAKPDDYSPFYRKLDSIEQRIEYKVTQRTLGFLDAVEDDTPWCLTASFVAPHFPSDLPEPYYSMYPYADMKLPENYADKFINKPWFHGRKWWPTVCADDLTEQQWQRTISAYYGCITMMDDFIGEILAKAKAHSGGRKTRVIFTADHGEMLGAHGKFDKHAYFYEEVLGVPLLICEDLNGNPTPAKRKEFVGTQDIAQTFYDLCGQPYGGGRSLMPLVAPDYSADPEAWPEMGFSNYYKYNGHSFEQRCIKTPRYKYVWCPQDIDELYDLENDPGEMKNLSDKRAYQPVLAQLKALLHDRLVATDDPLLEQADTLPPAGVCGAPAYPPLVARI